jgi:predicted dehydrogenase
MKAVLQNMKTGKLEVQEVPAPAARPEGLLVAVDRSLISLGTERAIIALAKKGPLGKARQRPDLVRKVLNKAKQEGLWNTYKVVQNLLESPIPLGYSCSGEVLEAGRMAAGFEPGQRVACAGLNFANHAEVDYVPRNLAVPVPDGVSHDEACFVTLGAIAMQGLRLAKLELGDRVVVLGLGLVGQLAAQLARCDGATVLASDIDPTKLELATRLGAHHTAGGGEDLVRAVESLTQGHGADAVLVCAATKSSAIMQAAAEISRLKGRVVIVGDVGLELERRPFFEKEIDLVISRSYGPGRYDPAYETHGTDYPLPYVRWTEQRNMSSFLELIAQGQLQVKPLVTHHFPIDDAEQAYDIVTGKVKEPAIAIVLNYDGKPEAATKRLRLETRGGPVQPAVRFGVIGAGQFAKGVLLPAFRAAGKASFRAFCTSSGLTSRNVAERYKAEYCTGEPSEVLQDPDVDALILATRHDQHAELTSEALKQGKAVFVEKPLTIDEPSLAAMVDTLRALDNPRLMVGYNRRFSPLAVRCKEFFAGRQEPLFVSYRVNAGQLPAESWHNDPVQGGGRIIGEVCHFVDMIQYLTGAAPARVHAEWVGATGGANPDPGVTVTLRMEDGSVGTIHYMTNGDPSVSKEYMEAFAGQRTAILDNYRSLAMHRGNKRKVKRLMNQAKGHAEEAKAFVEAMIEGKPMPIGLESQIATTQVTFLIHQSLETGLPVDYVPPRASREPSADAGSDDERSE